MRRWEEEKCFSGFVFRFCGFELKLSFLLRLLVSTIQPRTICLQYYHGLNSRRLYASVRLDELRFRNRNTSEFHMDSHIPLRLIHKSHSRGLESYTTLRVILGHYLNHVKEPLPGTGGDNTFSFID